MADFAIRAARAVDLAALQPLIQRAYRGEASRAGWTHEADLITEGERISHAELQAMLDDPREHLLVATIGPTIIGCVRIADVGDGLAYLGLLAIEPALQAAGHGKRLIAAAEDAARTVFAACRLEMTVIDSRAELIAYYERRGYSPVGTRAFPIAMEPPLHMVVLEKPL